MKEKMFAHVIEIEPPVAFEVHIVKAENKKDAAIKIVERDPNRKFLFRDLRDDPEYKDFYPTWEVFVDKESNRLVDDAQDGERLVEVKSVI